MILGLDGNIKTPPESAAPFIKAQLTLNTVFSGVISGTNEQSILWDLLTIIPTWEQTEKAFGVLSHLYLVTY